MSAAYLDARGRNEQLTFTINNDKDTKIVTTAELYGGFEPEFLAVTRGFQYGYEFLIADIDPSARVTKELVAEAFGLVADEGLDARLKIEGPDEAFEFIRFTYFSDGRFDDPSYLLWEDISDLLVARLSSIRFVEHQHGRELAYYIVGKTAYGELVGIKQWGPRHPR